MVIFRKKYKPYILKYKALILKYVPCIFYNMPYVFSGMGKHSFFNPFLRYENSLLRGENLSGILHQPDCCGQ